MNKRFGITVLLVVILLAGAVMQTTAEAEELQEVTLATAAFQDTLLPIVGEEFGWYEEMGLDVDIKLFGWSEIMESLSAGVVDVAVNNMSSVVGTHNNNPQIVYYYGFNTFDNGFALMIRPDSKFKTVEEFKEELGDHEEAVTATTKQLAEMTVITTGSTDMEQGVATAAEMAGLDFEEDVKVIDMNPSEGLAAFLSGSGDAYIGGIAQRERARQEGMKVMLGGVDLGAPPINGYVTTRDYAEENPEVMAKLINVWFRTVQYMNANQEEGAQIVLDRLNETTGSNMTKDNFKMYWNNYEHFLPSAEAVENDILDPEGRNYWKDRWDSCNFYFKDLTGSIEEKVDHRDAFMMEEAQEFFFNYFYGEKYEMWLKD